MSTESSFPTAEFLAVLRQAKRTHGHLDFSRMDEKSREWASDASHNTLRNLLFGIRGIGSMLYWTDVNAEPPYDYIGDAGLALEALATLANECLEVEDGVRSAGAFEGFTKTGVDPSA